MTSFNFAVACGKCHPGGGPLEYDRTGIRYDHFASDPKNKITSGGNNHFDGDYYKAQWQETGVIEADCLLCHSPRYNMDERNKQISFLNFKWAATSGAGIAEINGAVKKGEIPTVEYQLSKFDAEGHLDVPIIKEVPTENCLFCHLETDWKKKGTSYNSRFDVHLRAGVKCIECHPGGSSAKDPRINSKENHNFGKGDDPGSLVRNDLDNTMVTCQECHEKGLHNAPVMKHASFFEHEGVFEAHSEKIACQTCHVPQKAVKAALIQDSVAFNPLPRVPSKLKKIWSFYGPDVKPWNYYGEVSLTEGTEERPLFFYQPQLRWYKEKLYPVVSLYSIWYGLKTEGEKGLDQIFMQDIYGMWSNKGDYPLLSRITDDNGDWILIHHIDAHPDLPWLYLATQEHSGVFYIACYDLENREFVFKTPISTYFGHCCISPDGSEVYLTDHGLPLTPVPSPGTLFVFDAYDGTYLHGISLFGFDPILSEPLYAGYIVFTPTGEKAYVGSGLINQRTGSVFCVNTSTRDITKLIWPDLGHYTYVLAIGPKL